MAEQELGAKKPKKAKKEQTKTERKNTAIYVTSLPTDVTVDELNDFFKQCGVILEEAETGKPRIKIYSDEAGNPKGDALIVFFKPESVNIAILRFDETDFRFGEKGPNGPMRITAADTSYKKQQAGDAPREVNNKSRKQVINKMQQLNNRLADWSDDDLDSLPAVINKFDKVVVLKHMFSPESLAADPTAILDIKEDVREEGEKLGEITNVVLFDREADGVITVRFTEPEAAKACAKQWDGRHYDGRKVEAYVAQGPTKFKKTKEKKAEVDEVDSEEERRLDEFGKFLEDNEGKAG
jgi:HIV Tat-specific factor 1